MNDLTPDQSRQLLAGSTVAHLAVISDGEPYVSPASYVFVDDAICLRTGPGRRVEAIRQHPRVCVEVSEYDDASGDWESVIVWGEAEFVEDPAAAQAIVLQIMEKYREALGNPLSPPGPASEPEIVIRIPVAELTGRSSGSYFSVRRRPGRL